MLAPHRGALLYYYIIYIATFYNHRVLNKMSFSTYLMTSKLSWWRHPLCVTSIGPRFGLRFLSFSGFLSYLTEYFSFLQIAGWASIDLNVKSFHPSMTSYVRYDVIVPKIEVAWHGLKVTATSAHARINHLDPAHAQFLLDDLLRSKKNGGSSRVRTLDLEL